MPAVDAGDLVTAVVGFVGTLVGAVVSYFASMRAAKAANTAAWAGHTIALAQSLIDSDDPAMRAAGAQLLAASVRAIADAPETPDKIKEATRSGDLADAVDEVRTVEQAGGEPAEIELAEEDEDGQEGSGHPQAS